MTDAWKIFDRDMGRLERQTRRERRNWRTQALAPAWESVADLPVIEDEQLAQSNRRRRAEANSRSAQIDRDVAARSTPLGLGHITQPIVNTLTDPDRRASLGDAAQAVGRWALSDDPILPPEWFEGPAPRVSELLTRENVERVPGQIGAASRATGNALSQGVDWVSQQADPEAFPEGDFVGGVGTLARDYGPGILRAVTYGPFEDERRLQRELDVARALGEDERASELADEANLQTGFGALNVAFAPADVPALIRGARAVNPIGRIGRVADSLADAPRVGDDAPTQRSWSEATDEIDRAAMSEAEWRSTEEALARLNASADEAAGIDTVNDLDQWMMGGYTQGAPSRMFMTDDLIDRQRAIDSAAVGTERRDSMGDILAFGARDDGELARTLDQSLGEYSLSRPNPNNAPLLGQIGVPLAAAGGTGALLYANEAQAGDGSGEEGDDWTLPALGAGAAALAGAGYLATRGRSARGAGRIRGELADDATRAADDIPALPASSAPDARQSGAGNVAMREEVRSGYKVRTYTGELADGAQVTVNVSHLDNGTAGVSWSLGQDASALSDRARGAMGLEAMDFVRRAMRQDMTQFGPSEYHFTGAMGRGRGGDRRYERLMQEAEPLGYRGEALEDHEFVLRRTSNAPDGGQLGAGNAPITAYRAEHAGAPAGDVEWWSASPRTAEQYTYGGIEGATMRRQELAPQNPLVLELGGRPINSLRPDEIPHATIRAAIARQFGSSRSHGDAIVDEARKAGYDAVIFRNARDPALSNRAEPDTIIAMIRAPDAPNTSRVRPRGDGTAQSLATGVIGGGALGGALLLGGDAEAEENPELEEASAMVRELEANKQRFEDVNRSDPTAVRRMQEFLQSQGLYGQGFVPDGEWGQGTQRAVEQYLERNRADLEDALARLEELEQQEASRSTRAGPAHQAAREIGPWAATLGAYALGHGTRLGAIRAAGSQLAGKNRAADALLTSGPVMRGRSAATRADPARRAANINEFWRLGGAGERVPFAPTQAGQRGFKPRLNPAESSELFPPENAVLRGGDIGVIGAAGGEAALSGGAWYLAQQELDEAQAAVDLDPSEANLARLERARDMVAIAMGATRAGLGFAAGRIGGAAFHPYGRARPDIAAAERERMLLSQYLARKK